jgi:hypothetical protein
MASPLAIAKRHTHPSFLGPSRSEVLKGYQRVSLIATGRCFPASWIAEELPAETCARYV